MLLVGKPEKAGFELIRSNKDFKYAFIRSDAQYSYGAVQILKRHNESDEVFVLLAGSATLLTRETKEDACVYTELKKGTAFCLEAGTWHYLAVSDDALVFVVENSQVSALNTDALDVSDEKLYIAAGHTVSDTAGGDTL